MYVLRSSHESTPVNVNTPNGIDLYRQTHTLMYILSCTSIYVVSVYCVMLNYAGKVFPPVGWYTLMIGCCNSHT